MYVTGMVSTFVILIRNECFTSLSDIYLIRAYDWDQG